MHDVIDAKQRLMALDPKHSFIVQAPAGSGKTELLTQRFLVLLAQVQQPEEIIAITFTRKAAAEMRNRILSAMDFAASQPEPEAEHAKRTWQLARNALQRCADMQWGLHENPNRLQIQTIDSLCARITRQMPVLAGFGAQPRITDNASMLYRDAARAVLQGINTDSAWQAQLQTLLLHLDNDFNRVENLFMQMLQCRDQWLPHIISARHQDDLRTQLENALANIVSDILTPLATLIPSEHRDECWQMALYAAHQLDAMQSDSPITQLIGLTELPPTTPEAIAYWQALAKFFLTEDDEWRRQISKTVGFPAPSSADNAEEKAIYKEYKERMQALLKALQEHTALQTQLALVKQCPPAFYDDKQWQIIECLLVLLPILVAQLKILFSAHASVDFTEVAMSALYALGEEDNPTDIALYLDYKIQHLLVDEFQDTSISQFRLLEHLTAGWQNGDGRTLFVVGDPMQSIYRFRQAEVSLFLRAQQYGIQQMHLQPLHLQTNFRSNANIVNWVNDAFSRIFPVRDDMHTGAVSYSVASAFHPEHADSKVEHHLCADRQAQAQQTVSLIKDIQNQHGDETIAILVKARTHLFEIMQLLQAEKIPFQAVELETLAARPVIQDLWALTQALLHPSDRIAWYSVLRAPWCGLTLAELTHISENNSNRSLLADLPALANSMPRLSAFLDVITPALTNRRRQSLRNWLEQTWQALGGPACLREKQALLDAQAYFALLENYDVGGELADTQQFAETLERLFANPDPNADKRLQIMTIHKSKGLEFDHVILPALERGAANNDLPLLMWEQRTSEHSMSDLVLAPIKASIEEKDPIYSYLRQTDKQKGLQELSRLFYVAATRAKQQLHLLYSLTTTPKGTPRRPTQGSLLAKLWPLIDNDNLPMAEEDENETMCEPESVHLYRHAENWKSPIKIDLTPTRLNPVDHASYIWQSEHLRHVGTLTHRLLRQICEDGIHTWSTARIEQQRSSIQQQLRALGVLPAHLENASETVITALTQSLADTKGRWLLDNQHQDSACELALSVRRHGEIKQYVIDRTFIADNVRWIVDYKVVTEANDEDHRAQLERYATLFKSSAKIRLAIYYPLQQQLSEWNYGER